MAKVLKKKDKIRQIDKVISKRSKQLSKVIKNLDGFKLWSEVPVPKICKTRITSLNRALKSGGIPGGLLGVIHGPSQGGKTLLLAEIIRSASETGGWGVFIDAECRAVDLDWFNAICGNLDEILYYKPETFEKCIENIELIRNKFRISKDKKEINKDAFLSIGIDSINRLIPAKELEELLKGKVEARGYPLRALLTSKWLDKIIPTLKDDEILSFIQRESVKMDAMPGQKKYNVKGGLSSVYDGSWILRVTSAGKVKVSSNKKEKVTIGEKHEIEVLKNTLGPHLNEVAHFYSSIGIIDRCPLGLDLIREVREESLNRKLIKFKQGNGYYYNNEKIANNKVEFYKWLKNDNKYIEIANILDSEFNE